MSATESYHLFAVLTSTSCVENLAYGPSPIDLNGEIGGSGNNKAYLSTNTAAKSIPHTEWLQVVTDGGQELLRIHWTFATARTLQDHFTTAVSVGEHVSYRVNDVAFGKTYNLEGVWRFSSLAGDMAPKFAATETRTGFSSYRGAWGAGSSVVDGGATWKQGNSFIGVGYPASGSGGDADVCNKIFRNKPGDSGGWYYYNLKTYMYYAAEQPPTAAPSSAPTNPTALPTAVPSERPTAVPSTARPSIAPSNPTPSPTIAPTPTISMLVQQVFIGVQLDSFLANREGYEACIINTVTSTSYNRYSEVRDIFVQRVNARRLNERRVLTEPTEPTVLAVQPANLRAAAQRTSEAAVQVQYTVSAPASAGVTCAAMSAQLTESVTTGEFEALLQRYAALQNVPQLRSAAVRDSVHTCTATADNSSDNSTVFTTPVLVGVIVALCAVLLLVIYCVVRFCSAHKRVLHEESGIEMQEENPVAVSVVYVDHHHVTRLPLRAHVEHAVHAQLVEDDAHDVNPTIMTQRPVRATRNENRRNRTVSTNAQ